MNSVKDSLKYIRHKEAKHKNRSQEATETIKSALPFLEKRFQITTDYQQKEKVAEKILSITGVLDKDALSLEELEYVRNLLKDMNQQLTYPDS